MKNLTDSVIVLILKDGTRDHLAAHPTPPMVVVEAACPLGFLDTIEIVRERVTTVDFHGLDLSPADQPFIVSREVFDALPAERTEFITPDYDSAIYNAFKTPQVIRRFVAKAGARIKTPSPIEEVNQ